MQAHEPTKLHHLLAAVIVLLAMGLGVPQPALATDPRTRPDLVDVTWVAPRRPLFRLQLPSGPVELPDPDEHAEALVRHTFARVAAATRPALPLHVIVRHLDLTRQAGDVVVHLQADVLDGRDRRPLFKGSGKGRFALQPEPAQEQFARGVVWALQQAVDEVAGSVLRRLGSPELPEDTAKQDWWLGLEGFGRAPLLVAAQRRLGAGRALELGVSPVWPLPAVSAGYVHEIHRQEELGFRLSGGVTMSLPLGDPQVAWLDRQAGATWLYARAQLVWNVGPAGRHAIGLDGGAWLGATWPRETADADAWLIPAVGVSYLVGL